MRLQVFDTHIKGSKGPIHIDILMPEDKTIDDAVISGNDFMKSIGEEGTIMTQKNCRFCHIHDATDLEEKDVKEKGYSIIKMSGC